MPENSAISALPADIAAWLAAQDAVNTQAAVITAFPASNKPVPLSTPIVAVGLSKASITDKFVANDDGVLEEQEYCRTAELRISFTIHVPYRMGGAVCHSLWTLVTDLLTFASDLNITASGCNQVKPQRDTDSFSLEAWCDVLADFCPAESTGLELESFLPKDILCGSHISNTAIHLSAADRAWINAPYRSGTYIGDGTASRTIALDVSPVYVTVWADEYPPFLADFTAGTVQTYAAQGSTTAATLGLSLTASGFRLTTGSAATLGNTAAALNIAGLTYAYFALVQDA
ncbi:MAG: hypothetical protein LBR73_04585 [Oscillospiraceae bacterium]|jgi:hypothetical protein|nr:hypothetical protein [Oscillospiraceae bacterium]